MKRLGRRGWWVLAGVVLLGVAAVGVVLHVSNPKARFDRLRPGMTLGEVETTLGGPEGDYGSGVVQFFHVVGPGRVRHPDGRRLRVWYFDEGHAEVLFDGGDRLVATYWSSNDFRPSVGDRLRHWWRKLTTRKPVAPTTAPVTAVPASPSAATK
jgi:hypothetical protein